MLRSATETMSLRPDTPYEATCRDSQTAGSRERRNERNCYNNAYFE
jgi:hypothetical protein